MASMCSSYNGVKQMILLVFLMQTGTALTLNMKATRQEPQTSSRILDSYEKGDPFDLKQMDPNAYYDDFYNQTEWEESEPHLSPKIVGDLLAGTNGADNLCMGGHFVPELFVIGGIASSTTSLCMMLRGSPALFWPARYADKVNSTDHPARWKEGHYFDFHRLDGIQYMANDFPFCTTKYRGVAVEGSSRYSQDPEVPGRIAVAYWKLKSQLKFVFVLREPLARLHSHYYHSVHDNWCIVHKQVNFSTIVGGILASSWNGKELIPQIPKRNIIPGCSDFLEGSLYVKQLEKWFTYFQPSQFILVPFLHSVDPGNAGRSSEHVSTFLWSKLGVNGIPGELIHSNKHDTPQLKDEHLTKWQLESIREWFDKLTGPAVIANLVRSTGTILFQYTGDPNNADQIAQWLSANW